MLHFRGDQKNHVHGDDEGKEHDSEGGAELKLREISLISRDLLPAVRSFA